MCIRDSLQTNPTISLVNLQGNVPAGQSGLIAGTNIYLTGSTLSLQTNPAIGVSGFQGVIAQANLPQYQFGSVILSNLVSYASQILNGTLFTNIFNLNASATNTGGNPVLFSASTAPNNGSGLTNLNASNPVSYTHLAPDCRQRKTG